MATTTEPITGETTRQLINYRTDAGVARHRTEDCRPASAPRASSHRRQRAVDDPALSQQPRDSVPHRAGRQPRRFRQR